MLVSTQSLPVMLTIVELSYLIHQKMLVSLLDNVKSKFGLFMEDFLLN
jgi:hypothetical protein